MPRAARKSIVENMQYQSRPVKYMYAYTCLPLPLQAYIWGVISYEDAIKLIDTKVRVECENLEDILSKSPNEYLTEKQKYMFDNILKTHDPVMFRYDIRVILDELDVDHATIPQLSLTYPQFFMRLMTDEKYDTDTHVNILRRFEKQCLPIFEQLHQAMGLYVDRELGLTDIEDDFLKHEDVIKSKGKDEILEQLELICKILDWSELREFQTEAQLKCAYYYKHATQALVTRLIKEMQTISTEFSSYDVASKMQQTGTVLASFLPKGYDRRLEIYMDLLLLHARETLKDGAKDKAEEQYLLQQFDKIVNKPLLQKLSTKTHKKIDSEATYMARQILNLSQLIFESCYKTSLPPKSENVPDVSKSGGTADLEIVMDEFLKLQDKYLSNADQYDINKLKSVYSFMNDSELMYIMGVLNHNEYRTCQQYQTSTNEETGEVVSWEQPITDLFAEMLNAPEGLPPLPLTKENVEAMEQIRLASRLYYDMYMNDGPARIDLVNGSIFENDYKAAPTLLRQEGLLLEDLILLNQETGSQITQDILRDLVVSYWNESVSRLLKMKHPEKRPEIQSRVRKNLILFHADVDKVKGCCDCFRRRKVLYPYLIALIKHDVLKTVEDDYVHRNHIFEKVCAGLKPFERKLGITRAKRWDVFLKMQKDIQNGRLS